MAMFYMEDFKGHGSSTVNGVFIAVGWAETAFAAKRNKLKISTMGTGIHDTIKGRIAAIDHAVNIFHNRMTWV